MREEHINDLIKKYKDGLTSVQEEELLFKHVPENDLRLQQIGSFINQQKIKVPENLNERLWETFDKRITPVKSIKKWAFSMAASIVLCISLYTYYTSQKTLTLSEKEALLEEAKSMFIDTDKEKEIYEKILENELIIVYTKIKK